MHHATRKSRPQGSHATPYDERTFRYLLGLEQRRSDRSGRPFLLVLVDFQADRNGRPALDAEVATTIFAALSRCLRDTDFIGWYEHDRRAGAVLTELGDGSAGAPELVNEKVMARGLLEYLPDELKQRLQIQVSRYPALRPQ
jgi:hypothetical protein